MPDHGAEVAAAHGLQRSDKWPEVEHAFRQDHPTCAACDSTAVQVHHRYPFHDCVLAGRPDLELDPRNLISLCEKEKGEDANDHHLLLGHLDDFKSYDPDVTDFVVTYKGMDEATIKANTDWQAAAKVKPKSYPDMTDDEKAAFRAKLDEVYPLES